MCNNEEKQTSCSCIADILKTIAKLQRVQECREEHEGCDRPVLGPIRGANNYNTRPVTFYNCPTNTLWEFDYELNGTTGTSTVFRVETVDDCCCTCRVLAPNPDTTETANPYVATNSFFTINLNCVGAVKCLADTYVACI